ncbi:hypothetical protein E2562_008381 [Oryza meyeriana var. granulata]|uniref:Uncharacterized protein n=1 Tax=Oryza meyeriana var. granulata TaxID=110450 RepID=A0A6G1EJC1_9ORYZ|nr:hypothetical protein E2562_008381 [Oryza meyeriana var. granulata]
MLHGMVITINGGDGGRGDLQNVVTAKEAAMVAAVVAMVTAEDAAVAVTTFKEASMVAVAVAVMTTEEAAAMVATVTVTSMAMAMGKLVRAVRRRRRRGCTCS